MVENSDYTALAVEKINNELSSFKGGNKETTISTYVARTLCSFCGENEQFAQAVYLTKRTLSECCAEIMQGAGSAISDIEVYRRAAQFYFPNTEIAFKMEISVVGEEPTEEELTRPAAIKTTRSRNMNKNTQKQKGAEKANPPMEPKAKPKPKPAEPAVIQITLGGW